MKTLFAIFLSLLPIAAFAQEPTLLSLYGIGGNGEEQIPSFVVSTQDNGFIVGIGGNSTPGIGNIDSFCSTGSVDAVYVKYSHVGTVEWSKCLLPGGITFPLNSGDFIYGNATNIPNWAFVVGRENSSGTVIWQKTYGNNADAILKDMIATDDGGFIMVGEVSYADTDFTIHYGSALYPDIGVIKLDSSGNKVWAKVIGGTYNEQAFKVIPGPDNGCYIFGATTSNDYDCIGLHNTPDSESDAYLVRLDANGNILWHRDLGGTGDDGYFGWGIANGKGGVVLTSGSNSIDGDITNHIGDYDYWAIEVDSNNAILWNNNYGSAYLEFPHAICKSDDGSIWITGESLQQGGEVDTSYGNGDAWIVHADSVGNFLSAKVLGSSEGDAGTMIYSFAGGNIITGGTYGANNGAFNSLSWYGVGDAFLATFAPQNQTSIKQISINGNVSVLPNPTHSTLNITFSAILSANINIAINNIFGQQVYCNTSMNKSLQVDVSEWPAGMYFVKITDENTLINVTKIEIQ